jgi:hypothetical protein
MPRRRYTRKTTKRRAKKTSHVSPLAHLARKVQGMDIRLSSVEARVKKHKKKYYRGSKGALSFEPSEESFET